ncbi:carbohydrate kinase [Rhodanobacter sp. 115]
MHTTLCFGEALIDFHAHSAAAPGMPPVYVAHAGGAPANVSVALARLGSSTSFIGMLGEDAFGKFLLDSLREEGVDTRYVRTTKRANTALAFVSLDVHGERSFSFYRPPSADLLFESADFQEEAFLRAHLFHVCSNSLTEEGIAAATLEGMRRARAAGALVSFDMNLRPALWHADTDPLPRLWSALHAADIVKLSQEEMDVLSAVEGDESSVCERLWSGHAQWLVVTDGGRPLRWHTRNGHGVMSPFDVPAVDATGAGDAFVGGLLHGIVDSGAVPSTLPDLTGDAGRRDAVLRFAAACGAIAVTRKGSFQAMPGVDEVHAFLHARS